MALPQYVRRSYGGGAGVAQLVQPIGSSDTTFTISPVTGWVEEDGVTPLGGGVNQPFTVVIDRFTPQVEKILCTGINLSTGVVTVFNDGTVTGRGYDGTEPQAHVPNGSTSGVQTCWSSVEADEANQAVFDLLGGGGSSLVGVPIGTLVPFAGTPLTLPTNFLVADGSSQSTSTYGALYSALTVATTGTTTLAGTTVSSVSSSVTPYLNAGMKVLIANSAGAVYTIATVSTTSFTVTSGTGITAGTAGAITILPYGAVDNTHFNLPDARSRVVAGQGANNTNAQPTLWVGQGGGEKLHTLVTAELASHNHSITDPQHAHEILWASGAGNYLGTTDRGVGGYTVTNSGTTHLYYSATTGGLAAVTENHGTGISATNNNGSGTGHNNMQPFLVATHIIRAS